MPDPIEFDLAMKMSNRTSRQLKQDREKLEALRTKDRSVKMRKDLLDHQKR